jgi:hypothetical protein
MLIRLIYSSWVLLVSFTATAQLEGEVTDQNNKGLANVIILATDSTGKVVDSARTDTSGLYVFSLLQGGKYKVEAKARGFLTAVFKNVSLAQPLKPHDPWDDSYYAIRLDIVLQKPKTP